MGNVSVTTKVKDGEYSHYPDVSEETCDKIKALIEADKPKPKFEPVQVEGSFVFHRPGKGFPIGIGFSAVLSKKEDEFMPEKCDRMDYFTSRSVDRLIDALQKLKAFHKANK